jgi:hypothetical protein
MKQWPYVNILYKTPNADYCTGAVALRKVEQNSNCDFCGTSTDYQNLYLSSSKRICESKYSSENIK